MCIYIFGTFGVTSDAAAHTNTCKPFSWICLFQQSKAKQSKAKEFEIHSQQANSAQYMCTWLQAFVIVTSSKQFWAMDICMYSLQYAGIYIYMYMYVYLYVVRRLTNTPCSYVIILTHNKIVSQLDWCVCVQGYETVAIYFQNTGKVKTSHAEFLIANFSHQWGEKKKHILFYVSIT